MIYKILVANRGEIAIRIIRTCKEMGIRTVAVYSTVDKDSLHVKLADESICIGSGNAAESYLNINNIIAAAISKDVDAIHPGYGFLSENPDFPYQCIHNNITPIIFIGPYHYHMRIMGDKREARSFVESLGIPCIPGSQKKINNIDEGYEIAKKIGYPIMIKASFGGGGKGIRIVKKEEDFNSEWEECKKESLSYFKSDDLYIEKYLEKNFRHIEIQIVGYPNRNVVALTERDCTTQRKNQKLIEETPCIYINDSLRKKLKKAAKKIGKKINYLGLGTIEFLVDFNYKIPKYYFIEMNTRIQVEHAITEELFDLDLVKEQILAARYNIDSYDDINKLGKKRALWLKNKCKKSDSHVIECRINAEDASNNYLPSPGKITNVYLPGGHGVRIDTHIYNGYTIPSYYDSMIAKIIVKGKDRKEAINRMKRCLNEIKIEGIKTNIDNQIEKISNI